MIVVITGAEGTGKTTLARKLVSYIQDVGHGALMIDDTTFEERVGRFAADPSIRRKQFNAAAQIFGRLASRYDDLGLSVVVSLIVPDAAVRSTFRSACGRKDVRYVHLAYPSLQRELYSSITNVEPLPPKGDNLTIEHNDGKDRIADFVINWYEKLAREESYI